MTDAGEYFAFGGAMRLRLPLIFFTGMLAACSGAADSGQILKQAQSSAMTGLMIIDARLAGAVPDHYAQDGVEAMRAVLAQASGDLAAEDASLAEQTVVLGQLMRARAALRRAGSAIGASDRAAIASCRVELSEAATIFGAPTPRHGHE
jgi:hypothetical protein